jgi:iron complex outermembrane receptor protein
VIVEAIAAEDIGKLPDTSIAESLARLPGLTTQRINSRAQGIVIRGLTGDFSTALLNGRQQVSTSGDRSVEFDQYPAELLTGVTVYKTSTASLIGQGLAGTINMQTIRPLALDDRLIAVNAFYQKVDLGKLNPDSNDTGYRYTLNYADQFADDTLGIAIGYSYTDQAGQGEQFEAWGYPTTGDGEFVIGGMKPFIRSSQFERASILGVVEYRPSENFHVTADLFVSDFKETQLLRGVEVPLLWSASQLQPGYTIDNGLVTQGVYNNVFMVMRNDEVWRNADVMNIGVNMRFGDGEGWVYEIDLSRSYMERDDNVLETYSGFGSNLVGTPDSVAFEMTGIGIQLTPSLDYTDASQIRLASPQGWGGNRVPGGQVGFFKGPRAEDELLQYMAKAYKDFDGGMLSKLEFGVAYTDREKFEIDVAPGGFEGWFLALPGGATSAPLPPSVGITDLSFIGMTGGQYSYNARALWESGYYETVVNDDVNLLANNYDVAEKITTIYAMADFQREIGGRILAGNVGVQAVHSKQTSEGLAANGTGVVPVSGDHSYWDIVPSLNLNFNLTENQVIRFSIARQLARQEMVDFRSNSTYGFNEQLALSTDPQNSPWSGGGGNPELEPWRSNSIDLTYERYFADGAGYFAVNLFYKDLVSYTYNENTLTDFTGFDTNSDVEPLIFEGFRNIPVNGDGGKLQGLEATLSIPGEKLLEALTGFGLIVSASFTDSSIEPSPGNTQPIPGLSEQVINATLYYERAGFSARVSQRYRSDYRGDISTFGPRGENFRTLASETVIDAQIGYSFQEGSPLEGLSITLQGSNLTDEPLFGFDNEDERLVRNYQEWGAEYQLGVSYKF